MSDEYVSAAEWAEWDDERIERARADRDSTAWQGARTKASTDDLLDQILAMDERLYLRSVLLEAAGEHVARQASDIAFLEDLLAAVLDEHAAKSSLRVVA